MRRSALFAVIALCVTWSAYAQDKVPVLSPGIHDLTLAQSGAPTIHYALSVPPRYRGEPVPLCSRCTSAETPMVPAGRCSISSSSRHLRVSAPS